MTKKLNLNQQYEIGLCALGFREVQSRSTHYKVFEGSTVLLYGEKCGVNEPRFVFVSRTGSSLRIGKEGKVTGSHIPVMPKTKAKLIALAKED